MLDPRTHHPINSFNLYDGIRNKTQNDDNTWEATNSGLWPSKPAQFGTEPAQSLSPALRTQAIARGQRELMEMVKNMPESNYELSLKDLVEHHHRGEASTQENKVEEEKNLSVYRRDGSSRKGDKMAQVKRNGNIDRGGFYLKVGFPFSLGSKDKKNKNKKKKNESSGNSSSKVSPKPSASDGSGKCVDKEWWKKSPSAMRESDSGESSINSESRKSSGSSSSSNSISSRRSYSRREKSGGCCWPFIRRPKSQTKK